MNKSTLILVVASLALGACSNQKNPFSETQAAAAAAGTYKNDGSIKHFKEYFQIDKNSVTLTLLCKNTEVGRMYNFARGEKRNEAKVQITVPARITENSIEILADAEQNAPEIVGGDCAVSLKKGVMSYTFDGEVLTVVPADGLKQTYTKIGIEKPTVGERVKAKAAQAFDATKSGLEKADEGFNKGALATGAAVAKGAKAVGEAAKTGLENMGRYAPATLP